MEARWRPWWRWRWWADDATSSLVVQWFHVDSHSWWSVVDERVEARKWGNRRIWLIYTYIYIYVCTFFLESLCVLCLNYFIFIIILFSTHILCSIQQHIHRLLSLICSVSFSVKIHHRSRWFLQVCGPTRNFCLINKYVSYYSRVTFPSSKRSVIRTLFFVL